MDYAFTLKPQPDPSIDTAKFMVALRQAHAAQNPPSDGCMVCGSPNSASPHFGSVSCLACAAFFRRTVALDITFKCKHDNRCSIYYELRMICRACRYEKCVAAGMKRHCVQKRRPNKKEKEEEEDVVSPLGQYEMQQASGSIVVKNEPISPSTYAKKERIESGSEEDIVDQKNVLLQYPPSLCPTTSTHHQLTPLHPFPPRLDLLLQQQQHDAKTIDLKNILQLQQAQLLQQQLQQSQVQTEGGEYSSQPNSSSVDSYTEDDASTSNAVLNPFYPRLQDYKFFYPETQQGGMTRTSSCSFSTPPSVDPNTLADCLQYNTVSTTDFEIPLNPRALLNHFVKQEEAAMDRRRMLMTEDPMKCFSLDKDDYVPYTRESLRPHTLQGQAESVKIDHYLGFEYLRSMPMIDGLNKNEKTMLFRFCALGFSVIDIAYISSIVMKDDEEILVFTDGTYSTCGPDDFSVGWEDEPIINMEDKKTLFLGFNHRFFNEIIVPMRKLRMDRYEHAALKALCCWKMGLLEYTVTMKKIGKAMQGKLLAGLHMYYKEIGREDADVRIGEIVLLMGTLFEMYKHVTDMYKQLDLFNLLKVDHITRGLLCV